MRDEWEVLSCIVRASAAQRSGQPRRPHGDFALPESRSGRRRLHLLVRPLVVALCGTLMRFGVDA